MLLHRRHFLTGLVAAPLFPALVRANDKIALRDLYTADMGFSDLAQSLTGDRIRVDGYMAPPLRADARFFVLTKRPMAVCPFCETEAEWPDDILAIYTKRVLRPVSFNRPIYAEGVLELGSFRDPELGFLSRVRLTDATYDTR